MKRIVNGEVKQTCCCCAEPGQDAVPVRLPSRRDWAGSKSLTPTARTLAYLRALGWTAAIVERRLPHCNTTVDAWGFADILAFRGTETLAVQATSTPNQSHRLAKIRESGAARAWVEGGRLLWVIGWKKYKKPVGRKHWRETVTVVGVDTWTSSQSN